MEKIRAVADAARALRTLRRQVLDTHGWSLRELYKLLELPGTDRVRDAHDALDAAVRAAYGMDAGEDILAHLLALNLDCAAREARGEPVTPPGLPAWVTEPRSFVSHDCVRAPGEDASTAESRAAAAHDVMARERPAAYAAG